MLLAVPVACRISLGLAGLLVLSSSTSVQAAPGPAPGPTPGTCASIPLRVDELAPADADFALGGQPAVLESHDLGRALKSIAGLDLQLGDWLALRERCLLSQLETVSVVGSQEGEYLWLLRGAGIANAATVECINDAHARRNQGQVAFADAAESQGACLRRWEAPSTSASGLSLWTLGDDTLLIASAAWAATAGAALADPSLRTGAPDLAQAFDLMPVSQAEFWFVGTLHQPEGYAEASSWARSVRNFAARVDLNSADGAQLEFTIENTDFGATLMAELQYALPVHLQAWVRAGAPSDVLSTLSVANEGSRFGLRWSASATQLRRLLKGLRKHSPGRARAGLL